MPAEYPTSSLRSLKTGSGSGGGGSTTIDGFTLSNVNGSQLGTYTFNNCTFYTVDSSAGTPVKATGTVDFEIMSGGGDSYVSGTPSHVTNNSYSLTSTVTMVAGASTPILSVGVSSASSAGSCQGTTSQTDPLIGGLGFGGGNGSTTTLIAPNVSAFGLAGYSNNDSGGNFGAIDIPSATNVDVSNYGGNSLNPSDTWTLTCGSEAIAIAVAPAITMNGGTDTWNLGRSDSVDAVLAAYANGGGTSGTLNFSGANATLGLADPNYIIITSNGVTVTGIS